MGKKCTFFLLILNLLIAFLPQRSDGNCLDEEYANFLDSMSLEPYSNFIESQAQGDTLSMVQRLVELADIQKNEEAYALSFDFLWEALLMCDCISDESTKALVNHELGVLFSILERYEESLIYFDKAIEIKQKMIDSLDFEQEILKTEYFSKAVQYNKMDMPDVAIRYLDMSDSIATEYTEKHSVNGYSMTQLGYSYMIMGEFDRAEVVINQAKDVFEGEDSNYLVMVYNYLGDVNSHKGEFDDAIDCYNRSIELIGKKQAHVNQRPILLKRLSETYYKKGDPVRAYKYLTEYHNMMTKLYGPNGTVNSQIFKVRNKYDESMSAKKELIRKQNKEIEESKLLHLKVIFCLITIILVGIIAMLFMWRRYQKEQDQLAMKRDKANMDEMIEIKNRELTSYTLQIIDKENLISQLTSSIKDTNADSSSIEHIVSRSNDLWSEFNNRFTEVNTAFYNDLSAKYPDLTPTELKHCALIKLNFSSKEMGRLLNISPESVHISRHRIRKKFNLERADNLTKFLSQF